jgi:hypothetical protein
VVVNAKGERFEETLVQSPLDAGAPFVKEGLTKKWRQIASAKDAEDVLTDAPHQGGYAILWEKLERRLNRVAEP